MALGGLGSVKEDTVTRKATVAWYTIGKDGTRRHAFIPGDYDFAYCGRGPAFMTTDGSEPMCQRCAARLAALEGGHRDPR